MTIAKTVPSAASLAIIAMISAHGDGETASLGTVAAIPLPVVQAAVVPVTMTPVTIPTPMTSSDCSMRPMPG